MGLEQAAHAQCASAAQQYTMVPVKEFSHPNRWEGNRKSDVGDFVVSTTHGFQILPNQWCKYDSVIKPPIWSSNKTTAPLHVRYSCVYSLRMCIAFH